MSDGLYTMVSGALAQSQALDVVANNIANVSATGFKADRVVFKSVLNEEMEQSKSTLMQVKMDGVTTDFRQGGLRRTDNPLDVALMGEGFFVVETARGQRYTRAGGLAVSPEGTLVTQAGAPILADSGAIRIDPKKQLRIDTSGRIWEDDRETGRLQVVDFENKALLKKEGDNLWVAPEGVTPNQVDARIEVGALEQSNVNVVKSMIEMILISRAHEQFHKSMAMMRSLDEKVANNLR